MDWKNAKVIGHLGSRETENAAVTIPGDCVELQPLPMSWCGRRLLGD
jgi:hypothetical protein